MLYKLLDKLNNSSIEVQENVTKKLRELGAPYYDIVMENYVSKAKMRDLVAEEIEKNLSQFTWVKADEGEEEEDSDAWMVAQVFSQNNGDDYVIMVEMRKVLGNGTRDLYDLTEFTMVFNASGGLTRKLDS